MVAVFCFFFFKQKTAYEMRISDWSSDVCSSDLRNPQHLRTTRDNGPADAGARGLGEIAVVSAGDFQTRIEMPHRGAGSRVLLIAAAEYKEGDFCLLCRLHRVMEEVRRGDALGQ